VPAADLAPDGHRLAYTLLGVGTLFSELWTADLESGERRQLARDQLGRMGPIWSPDGSRLAYQWVRETNTTHETTIAVRPAAMSAFSRIRC
jgi:Tol biopolymer transport system component